MRNFIKQFIPPIISNFRGARQRKIDAKKYTNEKFIEWWVAYKLDSNLDNDVIEMVDTFIESSAFYSMSKYWNYLNKQNLEQISEHGFENFKRTVSRNYYTWIKGISGGLGRNLLADSEKYNLSVEINQLVKQHDLLDVEQSVLFNNMTVLLYDYVRKNHSDLLPYCEESLIGSPLSIKIENRDVSQDILNSAIEFGSIRKARGATPSTVLEIGAGSGRVAEFMLKIDGVSKYIICDIVPALFISQKYLSEVYPELDIFRFKNFNTFEEIKTEFDNCDIGFLMPHQLKLIPDKYFDTFLAIDCLHEMKNEQVQSYFEHADRLADHFYMKSWLETNVPFDDIQHTQATYKTPEHWQLIMDQSCYIPSDFFERMYKISGE